MKDSRNASGWVEIFTPYITRNGRIIYPKNAKYVHFWVRRK